MHYTFLFTFCGVALSLWVVMAYLATKEADARQARVKEQALIGSTSIHGVLETAKPFLGPLVAVGRAAEGYARVGEILAELSVLTVSERETLSGMFDTVEYSTTLANPMTTQDEVERIWGEVRHSISSGAKSRHGAA